MQQEDSGLSPKQEQDLRTLVAEVRSFFQQHENGSISITIRRRRIQRTESLIPRLYPEPD